MCETLLMLFSLFQDNERAPSQQREGSIVSLFNKGDRQDPGNQKGITLLNEVGKLYSRVINNHLLKHIELNHILHERQGGFRLGRCCIDNIFSLNELIQGCIKKGKSTCSSTSHIYNGFEYSLKAVFCQTNRKILIFSGYDVI